jgi:hypothetical protein
MGVINEMKSAENRNAIKLIISMKMNLIMASERNDVMNSEM